MSWRLGTFRTAHVNYSIQTFDLDIISRLWMYFPWKPLRITHSVLPFIPLVHPYIHQCSTQNSHRQRCTTIICTTNRARSVGWPRLRRCLAPTFPTIYLPCRRANSHTPNGMGALSMLGILCALCEWQEWAFTSSGWTVEACLASCVRMCMRCVCVHCNY